MVPRRLPTRSGKERSIPHDPRSTAAVVERAVLVGLDTRPDAEDPLDELALLTDTAGGEVVGRAVQRRESLDPSCFLSKGKREQVGEMARLHGAGLVVFDEDLSPAQVRNLERDLKVRVLDRSELILDIFARRARTREAMLQVELAQLEYLLPRLTRMWTHLERQRGGIGTRGPGETQLEVDRRRIRKRIAVLKEKLERIEAEREVQRKGRAGHFQVALVGYTNAGKSTLFNQMTRAGVLAEDKLFATLDTTTRLVILAGEQRILLSDTVGFIRKLPHHLIASFRATLLEVREADLILHVVDSSHARAENQMKAVEEVLGEILPRDVPRLLVLNKADLLGDDAREHALRIRFPEAEVVSALSGPDVSRLRDRIGQELSHLTIRVRVRIPVHRFAQVRGILRRGRVWQESTVDGTIEGEYSIPAAEVERLRRSGIEARQVRV